MSAFPIIKGLTDLLIAGLSATFTSDPFTAPYSAMIFSDSPASSGAGTGTKQGLSFWPYRIVRDEFVADPSLVSLSATQFVIPPLRVDVWYLATPMTGAGDKDQLLVEKTLQYVYDVGPVALGDNDAVIAFETPGQEELFRLWSALDMPYALSCVITARHVAIDSMRKPIKGAHVIERFDRYTRMPT
ncbi:MAG: DUF4255 domain-containing protein [Candidatus Eremiobacteraeota bacterium]|nr:DUF4255 domain-containing protein [Candidatus Eremiobacteraeota bacterium]